MKKLILILTILATSFTHAYSNRECIDNYREATIDLVDLIEAYNDRTLNADEFSVKVLENDTVAGGVNLACKFTASKGAKKCIGRYKDIHDRLRDRVNLKDITLGNQDVIHFSEDAQSYADSRDGAEESDSFFSAAANVFSAIGAIFSEGEQRVSFMIELEKVDGQCGN